jgi:MacB-like periplasmic core domain
LSSASTPCPAFAKSTLAIRAPLSLSGGGYALRVTFPLRPDLRLDAPVEIKLNSVSSNYLAVMGLSLLRGRTFGRSDQTAGLPVALISERMAQQYWPNEDPVGKTFRLADQGVECRIVGVVANAPINQIGETPEPYI